MKTIKLLTVIIILTMTTKAQQPKKIKDVKSDTLSATNILLPSDLYLENTAVFTFPKWYKIDFTKVKDIKDVIEILKSLDIVVSDNAIKFKDIEKYLAPVDNKH